MKLLNTSIMNLKSVVWRALFDALHQENVSGVKADTVGCGLEHRGMGSAILGVRVVHHR